MTQSRNAILGDLWGGLAAMMVALPSAIAFGVTIFSPLKDAYVAQGAMAGILGATALGLVAAAIGGSRHTISLPSAPATAVLAALATTFVQQDLPPPNILLLLAMIGLLCGLLQIGLGLSRIGRLIRFIPYPVVSGYLTGVGLIIIFGQVPKFLGSTSGRIIETVMRPEHWRWQSILIGIVVIAAMNLAPRICRNIPAAIVAMGVGVAMYFGLAQFDPALLNLQNNALVIGDFGRGEAANLLDSVLQRGLALKTLTLEQILQVLAPAATLAVLLSIDTLKTCVVVDAMTRSHHDPDRTLLGQGAANIASALLGGVAGSGAMGATLVNISSGGSTQRSGIISGVLCLAAFIALSPYIAWTPIAALSGILIVVGWRMIDRESIRFFLSAQTRLDFAVILCVILVAVFGSLIAATAVGVALAIVLFLREQTRSSVVRHRLEGHEIFARRSGAMLATNADTEEAGSNLVVFELQGSLFFGTSNQLQTALEAEVGQRKFVILSMRRVQSLDVTATHVLEQIKDRLEEQGAYLVFCDIPKGLPSGLKMKRFLKETGVVRPTDKAFAFNQLDQALEWVETHNLPTTSQEEQQPLELAEIPVFHGQSAEVLATLRALLSQRQVKAGKRLYKAGETSDELYILRRGLVKVTVPIRKKESYHLSTRVAGNIVGGTDFLDSREHIADAHAVTDVAFYVLSRENFEKITTSHTSLALKLIETIAHNLSERLRAAATEIQALRA